MSAAAGKSCARWSRPAAALLAAASLFLVLEPNPAAAHDVPNKIVMRAFVKPDGDRLDVLVRVPLILLLNIDLPKRGPGYLDLGKLGTLRPAADATSKGLRIYENDRLLVPVGSEGGISLPSSKAFATYEQALAEIRGPELPDSTDVYWNQGFYDVHFRYRVESEDSSYSLDVAMPPEMESRLELLVGFMPPDGPVRPYRLQGHTDPVILDPRWHHAAWLFVKSGFAHIMAGADHLLFLLCLVMPFRRLRGLIPVVTSFTIAHSITLIASAYDVVPAGPWFPPLVESLIAASIFFLALGNIFGSDLHRRWLVTGAFGLAHGLGLSYGLQQDFQFAGSHFLLSLLSFNLGVEIAQVLVLAVALAVLALLSLSSLFQRFGVLVVSALLAHTSWHWATDRARTLTTVEWPSLDVATASTAARWLAALLVGGGAVWIVWERWRPRRVGKRRHERLRKGLSGARQ